MVIKVGDIINWKSCSTDGFQWKVTKMISPDLVSQVVLFKIEKLKENDFKIGTIYHSPHGWITDNMIKIKSDNFIRYPKWL